MSGGVASTCSSGEGRLPTEAAITARFRLGRRCWRDTGLRERIGKAGREQIRVWHGTKHHAHRGALALAQVRGRPRGHRGCHAGKPIKTASGRTACMANGSRPANAALLLLTRVFLDGRYTGYLIDWAIVVRCLRQAVDLPWSLPAGFRSQLPSSATDLMARHNIRRVPESAGLCAFSRCCGRSAELSKCNAKRFRF